MKWHGSIISRRFSLSCSFHITDSRHIQADALLRCPSALAASFQVPIFLYDPEPRSSGTCDSRHSYRFSSGYLLGTIIFLPVHPSVRSLLFSTFIMEGAPPVSIEHLNAPYSERWLLLKDVMAWLYLEQPKNLPLKVVVQLMQRHYQFYAS